MALFLAQPEHLEQGPEKSESASKAKMHQRADGRHLKGCNVTDVLINTLWCSGEGEKGFSYTFILPCALWCVCGHFSVCVSVCNRNCAKFLEWLIYNYIAYCSFSFMLDSEKEVYRK